MYSHVTKGKENRRYLYEILVDGRLVNLQRFDPCYPMAFERVLHLQLLKHRLVRGLSYVAAHEVSDVHA